MIKKIILPSIFFCSALIASAQSLPNVCSAYLPKILNKTIIYQADTKTLSGNNYGQTGSTGKYWDVYSDRCSNKLYSSPSTSSPNGKTLSFNQEVRIASISNGFALVYTENKKGGVNYPQISGDVKCLGWVPMDNLLLWGKCPTNNFGITRKALIVRNLTQEKNSAFGKISHHPDINNTEHVRMVRATTEFHYVMKEVGSGSNTRYLIAKTDNLSDATSDRVIEGWVSSNSFTAWNQRSCLEPNWDLDDVEYFISKEEKGRLYENSALSQPIQSWVYGQTNSEGEPTTKYRFPPRAMRFPILDNDSKIDNVFRVTAFGSPDGTMGRPEVQERAGEGTEKALDASSHVNIIVVIDGTLSMSKYFQTMSKAVLAATDYLDGNNVSVGAVIYRDYPDGPSAIEFHKCTKPDASSLQSFLKDIGRNGYGANSKAVSAHEAMYMGLMTAFDYNKMGYSPMNTNIVFIIGDCGNNPKDTKYTKQQVIDAARASNAQLFSFQVINQDKLPWDDFNSQLTDIFLAHSKYLYNGKPVTWKPITNGFRVDAGIRRSLFVSEMHRAQVGKELSEGELTAMINTSYKKIRTALENQTEIIANAGDVLAQQGSDDKSVTIEKEFLKRKLGADYEATVKANSLLAYEGYAKQADNIGHTYWQPVVFISSKELIQLNTRLEPLAAAARDNSYTTESRANYVNAVAAIIHSMTELSESEIMGMKTDEITRIIGGLNVSTPMLKGKYTLSQIKNPSACPDEEYKRILKNMSTKIDNLSSLTKSSRFKYQYEQNGTRYYWIPLNMIP